MTDPLVLTPPSQEPMLQAVGRGIQIFASIEMALGFVFASMMEPADRVASVTVMNAARHIDVKRRIVDAVADHVLNEPHLTKWHNLSSRISARGDVRNKLAHWTVSHWPGISSAAEAKNWKVALVPPPATAAHIRVMWLNPHERTEQPLFIEHLNEFHALCNELVIDLFAFDAEITFANRSSQKPADVPSGDVA